MIVAPSAAIPALWVYRRTSGLAPMCEHAHKPHAVDILGEQLDWFQHVLATEAAYLRRAHLLASLAAGGDVWLPSTLEPVTTADAGSGRSLTDAIRQCWSTCAEPPLRCVVDPEDSAQRLWLCPEHAKELAPDDSGNVFKRTQAQQAVEDASFNRWLRVGVALKYTARELASVLQQRVTRWYTSTLLPAVAERVSQARQDEAALERRKAAITARDAALADLQQAATKHALACIDVALAARHVAVPDGGTTVGNGVQLKGCKKDSDWLSLVLTANPAELGSDMQAAFAAVARWQSTPPQQRYCVAMTPFVNVIRSCCGEDATAIAQLSALAARGFAEEFQRRSAEGGVLAARALVVKEAVLLAIEPCSVADPSPAAACTVAVGCTGGGSCATLPAPRSKCDPSKADSNVCSACRGWARAIKSMHRKKRSYPTQDSWRNCVPKQWSDEVKLCVLLRTVHRDEEFIVV